MIVVSIVKLRLLQLIKLTALIPITDNQLVQIILSILVTFFATLSTYDDGFCGKMWQRIRCVNVIWIWYVQEWINWIFDKFLLLRVLYSYRFINYLIIMIAFHFVVVIHFDAIFQIFYLLISYKFWNWDKFCLLSSMKTWPIIF